jgi:hypothetical protein
MPTRTASPILKPGKDPGKFFRPTLLGIKGQGERNHQRTNAMKN